MEAVWLSLALVCGIIAQGLRVPVLIGYLAAGFILAEYDVQHTETLYHLADLGLSLLLFTVGTHLRAKSFFRPEVIGATLIHLALLCGGYTYLLWALTGELLPKLACALGFSSTVVSVSALDNRRELSSFLGRLVLGVLVVQDVVSVLLIAGDAGYELSIRTLLVLAIFPARYLVCALLDRIRNRGLFLLLGVAYAFLCDDAFSALGLSGHLGALAAGATLATHPKIERITKELWGIKELLLLALFLSIGMYGLPSAESIPLMLLLLALLPVKSILLFALFLLFRLRARTAFVGALSLTAYSEFTLVVAFYLQKNGSIPAELVSVTAVVTAFSFAVCSLLIHYSYPLWNRFESILSPLQRRAPTVDRSPPSLGRSDILIVGMGVSGVAAYDRAVELGHLPLGLDSDPARVSDRLQEDKRVIQADCQDGSFWAEVNLSLIQAIIFTVPTLRAKRHAIELIRKRGFSGRVLSLARDSSGANDLESLGVEVSVVPMVEAGRELAEQLDSRG